tara:strand:- start:586 stop:1266 length:681 start_codon:yes stop_codon:yes gene_type:complete
MRTAIRNKGPTSGIERSLQVNGYCRIAGFDEVGKGAWAGPLTVAAVVPNLDRRITGVRDSKMLTESERENLINRITDWSLAWSVGHATNDECDALGMSEAQKLAAQRAVKKLDMNIDRYLLDGPWNFVGGNKAMNIVRGDATCLSIAAASVIAKVTRDRMMREASIKYPGYGFEDNKGYPSKKHREFLAKKGACELHRRSWAFMEGLPDVGAKRREKAGAHPRLFS